MKTKETIFVQGGEYPVYNDEFRLVSPSGKNSLPYLWKTEWRAQWGCKHHSHTYKVNNDLTLSLVCVSWECEESVGSPQNVTLNENELRKLKKAIERNKFYD